MKKLLVTAFAVFQAAAAFAAFQYEKHGNDGYFTFDAATMITMSAPEVVEGKKNHKETNFEVDSYGYYLLSDPSNLIAASANGLLGTFEAGQEIGIWIRNTSGNVYTSTKTPYNKGFTGADGDVFRIIPHANNPNNTHWTFGLAESADSESGAPTGQPLPGLLATLLAGGGVLTLRRLRVKRSNGKS